MGQTRVDLLHLLEDLRDAYPGALEETILGEIVANALDSGAARVSVRTDPAQALLVVADDGRGFLLPERLTAYTQLGHFGLAGIVERVKLVGGQLTIASSPGMGTTVTALIPLSPEGGKDGGDE